MAELIEGTPAWAIPWHCLIEFLGVVTHPALYRPPTALDQALRQIDAWLRSPSLALLTETAGFFATLQAVAGAADVIGPRIHDARIAALCIHHGITTLYSADRDFSRFRGLRTENPLA